MDDARKNDLSVTNRTDAVSVRGGYNPMVVACLKRVIPTLKKVT